MDGSSGPDCLHCGARLEPLTERGSLECLRCWVALAQGLEPPRVAGYQQLDALGEGGSASVYLAREPGTNRLVALKIAREDAPHAALIFRAELKAAAKLDRRYVVPVLTGGQGVDGRAYLVMELMENGTLTEAVAIGRFSQRREILELVCKLARAVQHAHGRAVLHCDLKPENILFDSEGEPRIGDFGLAQDLDHGGSAGETCGGTRGWMSPEQARRKAPRAGSDTEAGSDVLTVASDVFSLGVLLYWLLARRLPFGDGEDFAERVASEPTPSPIQSRFMARELDWEASAVCARAMAKAPTDRYASAAELGDDLTRALAGQPIDAERTRPLRRVAKWVRRHRLLSLAAIQLVLLLLYLPLVPLLVVSESHGVLTESNSNAALHQAGAVMNEVRAFAERLQRVAEDPEVQRLVNEPVPVTPQGLARHGSSDVDNLTIFSLDGLLRARWPSPAQVQNHLDVSWRDYFLGAVRLGHDRARQVRVARTIRSTVDGQVKVEIATPMFDGNGAFVGVLAGARRTRSTFGDLQMSCVLGGSCVTALLSSRDRDGPSAAQPQALSVVAAPGLKLGTEAALDLSLSQRICRKLGCTPAPSHQLSRALGQSVLIEDYIDPVSNARSIGAFAAVGGTGLVVSVSTPVSAARDLTDRMLHKARSYLGVPLLLGLGLFGALLAVGLVLPARRIDTGQPE
jgi:serine/threonine protein kinase